MSYFRGLGSNWVEGCFIILLIWMCIIFVGSAIVQAIWNDIVVAKFNAPYLSFWEVFWLLVMMRFIFPTISNGGKSS